MESAPTGMTCQTDGTKPIEQKNIHEKLESHGIYKRFWNVTAEQIERRGVPAQSRAAWERVSDYIKNLTQKLNKGEGLILVGGVGTMKTTMAVAVLRSLIDERDAGYFIPMSSLLDTINERRERRDGSLIQLETRIRQTPLLVLDDLGAEYDHTWVQCKVDSIVAERYNRMRSTIITSNLAPADIKDRYQARIFDRLRATNELIVCKGGSLRTTIT